MFDDEDTVDELPAPPRVDIPPADRELLELAARAIGAQFEEVDGEGYGRLHFADGTVINAWNPLIHSDDAFALQVRLGMHVEFAHYEGRLEHVQVGVENQDYDADSYAERTKWLVEEAGGDDPMAASRRAVTRAASEIGKTM